MKDNSSQLTGIDRAIAARQREIDAERKKQEERNRRGLDTSGIDALKAKQDKAAAEAQRTAPKFFQ